MPVSSARLVAILQRHFGVWVYSISTETLSYSSAWIEEIIADGETSTRSPRAFLKLVCRQDRPKLLKNLRQLYAGLNYRFNCELGLLCHDGHAHRIELNGVVAKRDHNGEVSSIAGTATSVHSRIQHEESLYDLCQNLQSSEARYRALLHDAKSPIIVVDSDTEEIVDVNNAASTVTGYFKAELLKMKMRDLVDISDCGSCPEVTGVPRTNSRCATEKCLPLRELSLKCKNKREIMIDISCSNVSVQNRNLRQCILHDVSLHKRTEEALRHMASHDTLTGLPNRDLLSKRLESAINQAHENNDLVAICFADLNKFKQVNDLFGHDVGDFILKNFAARLIGSIRNSDTAARLGGDEFIFILRNFDHVSAVEQAVMKIISHVNVPYGINKTSIDVNCSIGISIYPRDSTNANDLLQKADQAMYYAKKNALPYYIWTETDQGLVQKKCAEEG
ncbi:MAG: diguanylate cyclase [Desulfuromonadaceae bacterium]|nr:diguanylate cyclase [Desulfuromonadaceae bacterium]